MTQRSKPDIFLAYAKPDRAWAEQFQAALQASGVDVWFDEAEIQPGDEWQQPLEFALRESKTLVLILTPDSISDPWTLFELGAAIGDHKRIIPIVAKEFDRRNTPPLIGRYQFLEESSPLEAARRVAETVTQAVQVKALAAVTTPVIGVSHQHV
jgi:hypothetical protein